MKFLEGGSSAWKCGWNNWGARWDCKRPVDNVSCSTESSTGWLYWAGLGWMAGLCLGLALFVVFGVVSP